jgi:alpha-aminoadipic semialdehyde synthase
MAHRIGLRREDKNIWERRVALTPDATQRLAGRGIGIEVERFDRRCFPDDAYDRSGATLTDDPRGCEIVLGIKEIPLGWFREGGAYLFFSHTIKGQAYNMPMLKEMVDKGCTLMDYECVTNDEGLRIIFFSRHAGRVGMMDSLWTLGQRLEILGHPNPLGQLAPAHRYADLDAVKAAVRTAGEAVASEGMPKAAGPVVVALTGGGNVAAGAREVFDELPHENVDPADLDAWLEANAETTDRIAMVHLLPDHFVKPKDPSQTFDFDHYVANPDEYEADFAKWLPKITMLVHGVYWDDRYPVLATREQFAELFADGDPKLVAIGDITCDIDGSIKSCVRETEPGDPVYMYDPRRDDAPFGFDGEGIAVMAVGNLPTELPIEASQTFSDALEPFIPQMSEANLEGSLEESGLPPEIARAVILWRGELTSPFTHLEEFLVDA